ncbi:hypothetical protein C8R47DRAFT_1084793 [Mycena vitilis]|nr:hypothetical protein C8R47DRAFT_1084793 [Mycena vitilis]
MPLLNPNAPTFHPSSYPHHPQTPLPHRLNPVSPDNPRRHEPGARISSLAPITGNALDRTRIHHFGPETRLPRGGNVLTRVRAASNHQEGRQRQGQPPEVRLGSIVSPQTLFTGHETRPNGQELFHAVFLNARMLINNPLTGHPGMVNGHVLATLVAAPADERHWPYEVAFSSSPHARNPLTIRDRAAHAAAEPQRQGGPYRLPIDRQNRRVPRPTAHAMDIADGIPLAPNWTTVPLPRMRPLAPQRLLEAPPVQTSTPAQLTMPPFTTTPLDVVMGSRNAHIARPSPSPYTTIPLDVVMKNQNAKAERGNWRAPYFLTHPPNEPPKCDTRAMVRFGTEARTGHHVLRPIRMKRGRSQRPDTPVPPFRLLTERPELLEDSGRAIEDASMPSASAPCSPLSPAWGVSNSRLETLQAGYRRDALSTIATPDKPGVQGFVFGVYKTLADVAEAEEAVETSHHGIEEESDEEYRMDTEESFVAVNNDEGGTSKPRDPCDRRMTPLTPGSAVPNDRPHAATGVTDQEAVRSRSPTLSSLSSSFDYLRHEDWTPALLGGPVSTSSHPEPPTSNSNSDASSPHPLDCRSTLPSPRLAPLFPDESDHDSLPSLRTIPSDNDPTSEPRAIASSRPGEDTTSDDQAELDTQIMRIARSPSTPINQNWPVTIGWTHRHASFVASVHGAEHEDALAFIRDAAALIDRSYDVLDHDGMRRNAFVELDVPSDPEDDHLTSEVCTHFTERVQRIRDTLAARTPELDNGGHTARNITSVPISLDGQRHRLFSQRALLQPFAYRYIIDVLARHHPDWIELISLGAGDGECMRSSSTNSRPPLPPFLKPHEYSQLRLFKYTLEQHHYPEVARVIDEFLRYRFREPEIVAHLLHSGMFDPHDIYLAGAGGAKFVTRRTAPKSHRASRAFVQSFRYADLPLQKRRRIDLRTSSEREHATRQ